MTFRLLLRTSYNYKIKYVIIKALKLRCTGIQQKFKSFFILFSLVLYKISKIKLAIPPKMWKISKTTLIFVDKNEILRAKFGWGEFAGYNGGSVIFKEVSYEEKDKTQNNGVGYVSFNACWINSYRFYS